MPTVRHTGILILVLLITGTNGYATTERPRESEAAERVDASVVGTASHAASTARRRRSKTRPDIRRRQHFQLTSLVASRQFLQSLWGRLLSHANPRLPNGLNAPLLI
ncbi:MAG: hypothetical protein ACYC6N_19655 [Pirellulaceae bacterium]